MNRLMKAPVLALGCLVIVAAGFLGASYVSGNDDPEDCTGLPGLEVDVSIDDPEGEVRRQCLDPGGDLVNDTLTGSIIEEGPPPEEVP